MASNQIRCTKDYRIFHRHSDENRPLNLKWHKRLVESMKEYGFIRAYPIICFRDKDKRLIIKDGQHRAVIAEMLGLPVYFVEEEKDFDIAKANSATASWKLVDYAQKHAANGIDAYKSVLEFANTHSMPVSLAATLLSGTTTFANINAKFYNGTWRVKDWDWANAVASILVPLTAINPKIKNQRFIEACMAVCRVDEFDPKRLISGAERCREKLVPYGTKEAYLDMLESIYNFHRAKLFGLKNAAIMAMRERNPSKQQSA